MYFVADESQASSSSAVKNKSQKDFEESGIFLYSIYVDLYMFIS